MMLKYSLVTLGFVISAAAGCAKDKFGPVDLGYAVHVPTFTNETQSGLKYATYANIRFAQPPTGQRRFSPPVQPPPPAKKVQNGKYPPYSTDCLMTVPTYYPFPGINGTTFGSEDCLFLDVKIPRGVSAGDKVPVLHWLYGSGWSGDPASLFQSLSKDDQNFITVSSNYRLGAFGWVSAPGEDMTPNAGLYDALAASKWIKDYISKFGGDPERATIMGESAGGGIVEHLLTWKGGKGTVPFQQAILTSPGYVQHVNSSARMTRLYQDFLAAADCDSVSCLRNASEDALGKTNSKLVLASHPSYTGGPGIGFGPIVDAPNVPNLPNRLLSQGKFHRIRKVLSSNMQKDGDFGHVNGTVRHFLHRFMQTPTPQTIRRVKAEYGTNLQKLSTGFATSAVFACYSETVSKTFGNDAWRYVMSIPPATHAQNQEYYFYNEAHPGDIQVPIARQMQEYLKSFIFSGDPNFNNSSPWPSYGSNASIVNISSQGFQVARDFWNTSGRCKMLQDLVNNPQNNF